MNATLNHGRRKFSSDFVRTPRAEEAFKLIELLVVVATLLMLFALLLPAFAGAKAGSLRAQCASQMKRLGVGFRLFENDHNDMFPSAAYIGAPNGVLAWDTYIHRYIGGRASDTDLMSGVLFSAEAPVIERCPADTLPSIGWGVEFARRSYAMPVAGSWGIGWDRDAVNNRYPLPPPNFGPGISWRDQGINGDPDWDAKSFRTSVAKDPGGTLLLVEQPANDNVAGNIWPTFSQGPVTTFPSDVTFQMNPDAPSPSTTNNINYGAYVYRVHGGRFNYLFIDSHVEPLKIEQTIGTGTTNSPKGMWTLPAGD
jgi:prepilin-type processing-associated H-X9-DG protein